MEQTHCGCEEACTVSDVTRSSPSETVQYVCRSFSGTAKKLIIAFLEQIKNERARIGAFA